MSIEKYLRHFNDCQKCERVLFGKDTYCKEHAFGSEEVARIEDLIEQHEEARREKIAERNEW